MEYFWRRKSLKIFDKRTLTVFRKSFVTDIPTSYNPTWQQSNPQFFFDFSYGHLLVWLKKRNETTTAWITNYICQRILCFHFSLSLWRDEAWIALMHSITTDKFIASPFLKRKCFIIRPSEPCSEPTIGNQEIPVLRQSLYLTQRNLAPRNAATSNELRHSYQSGHRCTVHPKI